MIGKVTGILLEKKPPQLLIDVHGLGYEVSAPMNTFAKVGSVGDKVSLYTHFVVREDAQLLYGFYDEKERRLFRDIIKVSGIGPKIALAILSSMDVKSFIRHIMDNNIGYLTKLPGIGKKTAERLVVEMKDRFKAGWQDLFSTMDVDEISFATLTGAREEALEALLALGYKQKEALKALSKVKTADSSSEELIKSALQNLVAH